MTRSAPRPTSRSSNAPEPRQGLLQIEREVRVRPPAADEPRRGPRLPSLAFLAFGDALPSDYYLG
jgi:hypothetical protein